LDFACSQSRLAEIEANFPHGVCSARFLVVGNSAADVFVELFKQSPAEEYLAKKIKRVVGLPAGRSRKHLAYSYMHTAA
jgi:hypothetical protein